MNSQLKRIIHKLSQKEKFKYLNLYEELLNSYGTDLIKEYQQQMVNDILSPRIKNEKSVYPTFYKRLSGLRSSDFMPLQEESDFWVCNFPERNN